MTVDKITVIIEYDGQTLIVNPDPSQISAINWCQSNGVRDLPDEPGLAGTGFNAKRHEFDGTGMFTLAISGERAAVTGTWYAEEDAPLTVVERRP